MSKRKELHYIKEQKQLLIAKADLQRLTFLLTTRPVFNVLRAADAGILAIKTGKAIKRLIMH
ncbi:MAG: hypothetical protein PF637_06795 [Spirochaetes bacterium]|jgi:hypothetical protein|nr:hypothetical protein [Spirochaetota bacterium]